MKAFEFDLNTAIGTLRFEKNRMVKPEEIREAVDNAGFEVAWIELAFSGRLLKGIQQELLTVEIPDRKQKILLAPGEMEETKRNWFELSKWVDSQKEVWVRGRVHTHEGTEPALVVTRYRVKR